MKKKSILIVYVLGLLILGELVVRLFFAVSGRDIKAFGLSSRLYEPAAFTGYQLKPGFKLEHPSLRFSINSLGFRGPEITPKKPENTYRIICLGGSSTFGFHLNQGDAWPERLQARCERDGTRRVEVVNAAVSGYTSFQSLISLQTRLLEYQPDLVIVYHGWNDLKYWPYIQAGKPITGHWSAKALRTAGFWQRLGRRSYLIQFFLALYRKAKVALTTPTGTLEPFGEMGEKTSAGVDVAYGAAVYRRNLEAMASICRGSGVKVIFTSQVTLIKRENTVEEIAQIMAFLPRGDLLAAFEQANRAAMETAQRWENATFVDLASLVPSDLNTLMDHIHPTPEGAGLIAGALFHHFGEAGVW